MNVFLTGRLENRRIGLLVMIVQMEDFVSPRDAKFQKINHFCR